MLSNAYFLAKFRFDTAKNKNRLRSQNLQKLKICKLLQHLPILLIHLAFNLRFREVWPEPTGEAVPPRARRGRRLPRERRRAGDEGLEGGWTQRAVRLEARVA